jgi:hypothetical protein
MDEKNQAGSIVAPLPYSSSLFKRSALLMTETELKLMAALAMTGLKRNPKNG